MEPEQKPQEATQKPEKGEDTTRYMNEMKDFKAQETGWEPSDGIREHPLFWFAWNEVPGDSDAQFLAQLRDMMNMSWILEASIEKSSDEVSMIVTNDYNKLYIELRKEILAVLISDSTDVLREVSARELEGEDICFTGIVCNFRWKSGEKICLGKAEPNSLMCKKHQLYEKAHAPIIKTLLVSGVETGKVALPTNAYYFWRKNKPEIASFIDDMAESFRLKVGWDENHALINELRYIAVQIMTRDIMHNKAIEADFKSAIHDPVTGEIVAFKAHYLLNSVTTFDTRIQQKLKDFGLLVPPSRTENPLRIPIELEWLWTPIKKVKAIETEATSKDEIIINETETEKKVE